MQDDITPPSRTSLFITVASLLLLVWLFLKSLLWPVENVTFIMNVGSFFIVEFFALHSTPIAYGIRNAIQEKLWKQLFFCGLASLTYVLFMGFFLMEGNTYIPIFFAISFLSKLRGTATSTKKSYVGSIVAFVLVTTVIMGFSAKLAQVIPFPSDFPNIETIGNLDTDPAKEFSPQGILVWGIVYFGILALLEVIYFLIERQKAKPKIAEPVAIVTPTQPAVFAREFKPRFVAKLMIVYYIFPIALLFVGLFMIAVDEPENGGAAFVFGTLMAIGIYILTSPRGKKYILEQDRIVFKRIKKREIMFNTIASVEKISADEAEQFHKAINEHVKIYENDGGKGKISTQEKIAASVASNKRAVALSSFATVPIQTYSVNENGKQTYSNTVTHGDFVKVTLTNGKIHLLTPKNVDDFIFSLKQLGVQVQ